jgi:tRNA A-37 threonylcarbamoyl transferase component Bud32
MPVLDLNALNDRITEVLKMPLDDVVVPETLSETQDTLVKLIGVALSLQKIQKLSNIRVEYGEGLEGCVCSHPKKEVALGSGAYGTVYSVHASPCLHLPKGVSKVAVKKEKIDLYWNDTDLARGIPIRRKIYDKAYKLGLGPRVYDMYVCVGAGNTVNIVTVMDLVPGKTWASMDWPDFGERDKAVAKIMVAVERLNKHGIIHHDLHGGNIMVTVSKKGVMTDFKFIDFDRAKFVQDEEAPYIKSALLNTYGSENTILAKKVLIKMQELGNIGTLAPIQPPTIIKKTRKARKAKKGSRKAH